jgi:hypothetical protein
MGETEKARKTTRIVLTKEPKVQSTELSGRYGRK